MSIKKNNVWQNNHGGSTVSEHRRPQKEHHIWKLCIQLGGIGRTLPFTSVFSRTGVLIRVCTVKKWKVEICQKYRVFVNRKNIVFRYDNVGPYTSFGFSRSFGGLKEKFELTLHIRPIWLFHIFTCFCLSKIRWMVRHLKLKRMQKFTRKSFCQ